MREFAIGVVYLGLPGLLLGLALGVVVRRVPVLVLLAALVGVAVRYGLQRVSADSSGDNDPAVILLVALVTNLLAFLVGAAAGRLLDRALASR
jgi:uncharacterized membrane protein